MAYEFLQRIKHPYGVQSVVTQWQELSDAQTNPEHLQVPHWSDVTVQVLRIVSGAPTVEIEGSLSLHDDAIKYWFALTDPTGVLLVFTAAAGKAVMESTLLIRPRVTAGVGAADVRIKATRQGSWG